MTFVREGKAGDGPVLIETRRGRVECQRSGDGPPILLLHGAMGGCDQGLLLGRAAVGSSGYELIAVSRPGYLGTALALGRTPELQADLCADMLDTLGVRRAAVRIVRRVPHEQGRAAHRQTGAELFVENQAPGCMEASPPIVGAGEVPLQNADLDVRVRRTADVVSQLPEVVADAPQPGLEVLRLVLVVVNSEDVEVPSG